MDRVCNSSFFYTFPFRYWHGFPLKLSVFFCFFLAVVRSDFFIVFGGNLGVYLIPFGVLFLSFFLILGNFAPCSIFGCTFIVFWYLWCSFCVPWGTLGTFGFPFGSLWVPLASLLLPFWGSSASGWPPFLSL